MIPPAPPQERLALRRMKEEEHLEEWRGLRCYIRIKTPFARFIGLREKR